ncbi:MAG: hypothetical protein QOH39_1658 [Verrucomicrobiota bacterium]|jgi:hypothetical protein
MPPLLESPPPATTRRPNQLPPFFRRLLISFVRFLIIVATSALLGGGWYLAKKGFGREWRLRVVEELHKRGVEASIRRLTLDPFRGLVAKDVRIFDYKNRENILAVVSEVSLNINYAALFHHQPFLNAIDIRNAQISLPLKRGEKQGQAQLKHFRAHVYFPPEQIYVSQAEGIFCGVRISLTGQLIKRDNYQPSPPLSEEEWEHRLSLVRRTVNELQKFSFPAGQPTLLVKFSGDLAEMEDARVEATLRGARIVRGKYDMRDLLVTAEWADETLNVTRCEWKDGSGAFSAAGSWTRSDYLAKFQAQSSIDATTFLKAFGWEELLADVSFEKPPTLEFSGEGDFRNSRPQLKIIGHARAPSFTYRNVSLTDLVTEFSWDGEHTLLRDFHLRHQSGQLAADLFDGPDDFRLNVHSTINPAALKSLFPAESQQFFSEWEWQRSPAVDLVIRGRDHDPTTWHGDGTIALDRTRFRGSWLNSASARVRFGDSAVSYENIRIARNEGIATGGFTYDFKNHEVRISNIKSSLFPAEVIVWIDPKLYNTVAPYRFRRPPNIHTDGIYQFHGGTNTRLVLTVDAAGMDYGFLGKTLPFDAVSAKLIFTNDRLEIDDLRGDLLSGNVRGSADISLARGDPHYRAGIAVKAIDFPRLTELYYQYKTARGQLNGNYDFKGLGSDARQMRGTGKVEVTNGNVFAIPIFGPLSEILNAVVPGSGYSIARKGTASFTIKDGVIHTDDFEAAGKLFGMLGHGDIHFLDDKLNFDVRMDASGPGVLLTPMYKLFEYVGEGSLKKPNWHAKRF